jgi:protein TonB
MRPPLAYLLSLCFHLSLMWLIAAADDAWLPGFAVRSGHSQPADSQAARARWSPPVLDSRLHSAAPVPVAIAMIPIPDAPERPPELPMTVLNADQRVVLHPPVEELLRRRTSRSVSVAEAPFAEFVTDVRPETTPEEDGRTLPPLHWGPIPEEQITAPESFDGQPQVSERIPAPSAPVFEPGNAPRDAIGSKASSGAVTDQNPQKLPANPEPAYPEDLRRLRIGGTVMLRVVIRPDGFVERVTVEKSSGHAALDDSSVAAVQKWRFEPARRGGVPVRFEVRVPITFAIRQSTGR